ncbi:hypothetical protein ACMFMG_008871 [Clarireedia jacksonii]
MRLLHHKNDGSIGLTDDIIQDIPTYAILSHTWGGDHEEATFKDIQDDPEQAKSKAGYRKIEFCGNQAASDGLKYFGVDTCCIDKSNNAEHGHRLGFAYCRPSCPRGANFPSNGRKKTHREGAWGLPLAIAIQDPEFSDYSSSVWKAFQFALQGILQAYETNPYAAFMAHFAASCDNASNLAEYIRLYRKFRTKDTASTQSVAIQGHYVIGQLRFLDNGFFDLAIKALAAVNMITVNWMEGKPNDVPYIEMHSLVRRWLGSTNRDKILTYSRSKMWLLGFGMYDQLNRSRVGALRFEPLLKEVSETLIENPRMLDDSQVPASEAILPLLLDAQIKLSSPTNFLPAGSAQHSGLRQFARELEFEIKNSYDENLQDIDWNSVFQGWARKLGEEVEYAVRSDAQKDGYMPKDVFLDTLDSYGCIPIAFSSEAPYALQYVGQTDMISEIKAEITARIESLLVEYLPQEAFRQLPAITPNEFNAFIHTWSEK